MIPLALAALGTSAISGIAGSRSARRAGEMQAQAAREAAQAQLTAGRESNELVRQMYLSNLGLQAPQIQSGQLATAALTGALGLTPQYQQQPSMAPQMTGGPMYTNAQGQTVDAQGNVIQAMPSMATGGYGASPEALQQAGGQFAGQLAQTFRPSDLTTDPSYQFRLNEGMRALQARGAATGMLQTGQGLRDISDYAQQSASQEYGSAYDRFMRNQQALYERLSGLAGVGQQATGAATSAGAQAAQTIGATTVGAARGASDYATSGAAAQAAGRVGSTQALAGGLQGGMQDWMTLQYLNRMPTPGVGAPQAMGIPMPRTIG
jgi:hypothetical protein